MTKIDKKIGELLSLVIMSQSGTTTTDLSRAVTGLTGSASNGQLVGTTSSQGPLALPAPTRNGFLDSSYSFGISNNLHLGTMGSSSNNNNNNNDFPTLTKLADISAAEAAAAAAAAATTTSGVSKTAAATATVSSLASFKMTTPSHTKLLEEPDIRMSQLNVVSSSRLEHPLKLSPSPSPPTKSGPDTGATEIRIHTDASSTAPTASNLTAFKFFE